jgi:Fe-S-cluster containining protein
MMSRQEFFALARGRFSTEELYLAYEAYATCPAFRKSGPFYCERCGACCRRTWRIEASVDDLQRWISEKRMDILENLKYAPKEGAPWRLMPHEAGLSGATLDFALTASMEGALVIAKDGDGCVYYDGSGCAIYDTRPMVCARFPDARLFEGFTALVQQR